MIELTDAQKAEDRNKRVDRFREGLKKLVEETQITISPQLNLIDTKYVPKVPEAPNEAK